MLWIWNGCLLADYWPGLDLVRYRGRHYYPIETRLILKKIVALGPDKELSRALNIYEVNLFLDEKCTRLFCLCNALDCSIV